MNGRTIVERIKKDDVTIGAYLPSFTLAQITEFIRLAIENSCINVTANSMGLQE